MNSRSTISNMLWRFLERCGAQGVSFVVAIVLARLLGPEDYGTIALVTVFTSILQVFIDSGLGTALIQKKNADNIDFSTVFFFNLIMCGVIYICMFFAAPFIADFYGKPEITALVRVLSLNIVISGISHIQYSYVSKNLMFKKLFFATLSGTILSAIIGIAMAYKGFGFWALVAQNLSNHVINALITWIMVRWRPQFVFSFQRFKGLFSYGWKFFASGLLDRVYNELRQLIIGKKYSSTDLAFYNKGRQLPNYLITNINTSIDSVLLPTMSKVQDDKDAVKAMTRRAIKTSSFIIWPCMVGLGVCAEPLIRLLLTESWMQSVPFLRIFCFTMAFYPVHTANLNAIKAMGRSDLFLRLEIIKKVYGIIAIAISMWFGVFWMAASLLVTTVISSFVNASPNKKLMGYSYLEQLKDMLPAILLAAAMGTVVYCVQFLGLSDILTLLVQLPVGIAIYVFGSYILKFDSFTYVLGVLKSFKKNKKA